MGKRRIRLIKKFDSEIELIGVDLNEERCKNIKDMWGIKTYHNLEAALENEYADCAFISTSPLSHAVIIEECLKKHMHIFAELNLNVQNYDENIRRAGNVKKVLFLSSTFLFRDEIKYIKNEVQNTPKKINYCYHVGQYLPDWHPWENYKDYFVGDKKTNGCRELLAIELPWITDIFGDITRIEVIANRLTNLDINYNDSLMLLIEHNSGSQGMLNVDVVSRKSVRNLEVYGEELYIEWDGTPTGLYQYNLDCKILQNISLYDEVDHLKNYSSFVIENAYYNEIVHFFACINGSACPVYSFQKDKVILELIDRIERGDTN